ncbi:hypothetical protein JB92DRAFT_3146620 [Gautieria morchelliformis]|nr:hypothetical protein JB92DRAFT_3146620 [Gautieria morchelliformis]
MYYVGVQDNEEWWEEWSPAWIEVGRHARWEKRLERVAVGYIQRALGVEEGEEVPRYIAVHVRHGDFKNTCGDTPIDECFAPLSAYARRVASISAVLSDRSLSIPPHHVLVTSDETSAEWWAEVSALGWRRTDHVAERTEERYGKWYVPLVDAVTQSLGVGFVGTSGSTMSLVAKRRVEDWSDGVGELVQYGYKDADAH